MSENHEEGLAGFNGIGGVFIKCCDFRNIWCNSTANDGKEIWETRRGIRRVYKGRKLELFINIE